MKKYVYGKTTESKNETVEFGIILSRLMQKGFVVCLTGDLGAGKTTLTQGIAEGLGINEKVISPTFNILKCYYNPDYIDLYHIDAYRLDDNRSDIGLDEFIEGNGICVIEWPDYISYLLPNDILTITITNQGEDKRQIVLESDSDKYKAIFDALGEIR